MCAHSLDHALFDIVYIELLYCILDHRQAIWIHRQLFKVLHNGRVDAFQVWMHVCNLNEFDDYMCCVFVVSVFEAVLTKQLRHRFKLHGFIHDGIQQTLDSMCPSAVT